MVVRKGREGSGCAVGAECGGHRLRHPREAGWVAQAWGRGQACVQALLCGPTGDGPHTPSPGWTTPSSRGLFCPAAGLSVSGIGTEAETATAWSLALLQSPAQRRPSLIGRSQKDQAGGQRGHRGTDDIDRPVDISRGHPAGCVCVCVYVHAHVSLGAWLLASHVCACVHTCTLVHGFWLRACVCVHVCPGAWLLALCMCVCARVPWFMGFWLHACVCAHVCPGS